MMIINILLHHRSDYYVMKNETSNHRIMPLLWESLYGYETKD